MLDLEIVVLGRSLGMDGSRRIDGLFLCIVDRMVWLLQIVRWRLIEEML